MEIAKNSIKSLRSSMATLEREQSLSFHLIIITGSLSRKAALVSFTEYAFTTSPSNSIDAQNLPFSNFRQTLLVRTDQS